MPRVPHDIRERLALRWYACHTRGRHEKRVRTRLEDRRLEAYLPLVPLRRKWHDREKVVDFPMFPGYLFVRLDAAGLPEIHRVPGVVRVVGNGEGRPAPIPEEEIEGVQRFASYLATGRPVPELVPFEEGDPVRVKEGPLAGVHGRVAGGRGQGRILLLLGIRAIGQGMRVIVEASAVEPLEEREPSL